MTAPSTPARISADGTDPSSDQERARARYCRRPGPCCRSQTTPAVRGARHRRHRRDPVTRRVCAIFRQPPPAGLLSGLTPSAYDSSSTTRCLGISKAGNSWARRVLIEIAWFWRKYLPDSPLSRWYASKTADQSPRIRRIMLVALARKLAISLWRYVETGLVPEGVGAWPWPSRTRGNRRHVTRAEPSEPRAQSDPGRGDGWSRLRLASLAPAKV
jgi:Transposase IS116/IS110/IS902 family